MTPPDLTITDIARHAGIRPSAIRYYESIGILPVPSRVNGRRRYDAGVLQCLMIIGTAQQMGFSIAEIHTLLHGFSAETPAWARWQMLAKGKLPEVDALIGKAQRMKHLIEASLACDCLTLEECAATLQTTPSS
ncbi:MAG: MerR family transcriptional regulator [Chloroflexota bacterium]|nr:MerR family transcriptional regulator [Chloroflexota bacterium]MDQ6905597.1 MerR family transcriptional regulator [Chloroflexota bacterium]